jgi:hypothetical protein
MGGQGAIGAIGARKPFGKNVERRTTGPSQSLKAENIGLAYVRPGE